MFGVFKEQMLLEKLDIAQPYKAFELTGIVTGKTSLAQLQEVMMIRKKGLISVKLSSQDDCKKGGAMKSSAALVCFLEI